MSRRYPNRASVPFPFSLAKCLELQKRPEYRSEIYEDKVCSLGHYVLSVFLAER